MGLVASGSNQPNASTITGPDISVASFPGFAAASGIILAILDCRNATGITLPPNGILPLMTASGGTAPTLSFQFVNDLSTTIVTLASGQRVFASDVTAPVAGTVLWPTPTNNGGMQRVNYPWFSGMQGIFMDTVPVLGPFCVVQIYPQGLNTVAIAAGTGFFNPLLLANTRSDYQGFNAGAHLFAETVNVGAGAASVRTVPVLTSGEVAISGSTAVAGALTYGVTAITFDFFNTFTAYTLSRDVVDAAGNFIQRRLIVPRGYLQVVLFNGTAGASNMTYGIVKGLK